MGKKVKRNQEAKFEIRTGMDGGAWAAGTRSWREKGQICKSKLIDTRWDQAQGWRREGETNYHHQKQRRDAEESRSWNF